MHLNLLQRTINITDTSASDLADLGFRCGFEFETVIRIPGASRSALADAFHREFDAPIGAVCNTYAGHKRQGEADYSRWHFTRDGSIDPDQRGYDELPEELRFLPIEIVSPVVHPTDAHDLVSRSFNLLRRVGGVANRSCGLHFTFSSPSISRETFNPLVYLILTSSLDQRDLRKNNRLGNRYCYPTLTLFALAWQRIRAFCAVGGLTKEHLTNPSLGRGAVRLAGLERHRHVSINLVKFQTDGLLEYRGFGGNYLEEIQPSFVVRSMVEHMECARLASDPDWIEQNFKLMLPTLLELETNTSFHTRESYLSKAGYVPGDMEIGYIGSNRSLPSSSDFDRESTQQRGAFYVRSGSSVIELHVNKKSRDVFMVFINFLSPTTNVATLVLSAGERPYVDIHRQSEMTKERADLIKAVAWRVIYAKTPSDLRHLLLRFFSSQTISRYRAELLPAVTSILRHSRVGLKGRGRSAISEIARNVDDSVQRRMRNRGRDSSEDLDQSLAVYEGLSAAFRSHAKTASSHVFSVLLERGGEYRTRKDLWDHRNDLCSTLVGATVIGLICGKTVSQMTQHIKTNILPNWEVDVPSLLRGHSTDAVANHIANQVVERCTGFFEVQNRIFVRPALDVALLFCQNVHKLSGYHFGEDLSITGQSVQDYAQQLADAFLLNIRSHCVDIQMPGDSVHVYRKQFAFKVFAYLTNHANAYDNSWSHSSRIHLIHGIFDAIRVGTYEMSDAKGQLGSRDLRAYQQYVATGRPDAIRALFY